MRIGTRKYLIEHTGWLLASEAPANYAKGERQLAQLDAAEKAKAQAHAAFLKRTYAAAVAP